MKKLFTILVMCALSVSGFTQVPEIFKYQSVLRDNNGQVIAEQNIGVQISILGGSLTGDAVYTETHAVSTDIYGVFNISIGGGTAVLGTIEDIEWASGEFFLQVSVDIAGGTTYTALGTSQFLSVPYAQAAEYADEAGTALTADEATSAVNAATADYAIEAEEAVNSDTADYAVFTEEAVYADTAGYAVLAKDALDADTADYVRNLPDNIDSSPLNELQNFEVSASGDTLRISSGNFIIIPGISVANTNFSWKPGDDWLDPRDTTLYSTGAYGDQVWMTENLSFEVLGENDFPEGSEVNADYGRLYTWTAAQDVCPSGWHLPSDDEWMEFEETLGMHADTAALDGIRGYGFGTELLEGGSSGFEAMLAGHRNTNGTTFGNFGLSGVFWSSTSHTDAANGWTRTVYPTLHTGVLRTGDNKLSGLSVRCVKD